LVEHRADNAVVTGSIPVGPTIFCEAKNGLERIKNLMKKKIFCEVRDLGLRSKKWPRTNKKFDEKENFL
jgi:hypothetical protein